MRIPTFVTVCFSCSIASRSPRRLREDRLRIGSGTARIAVADFDRDGYLDVAQAGTGDTSVGIWVNRLSNGQGFARFRTIPVGGGPFDMASGDLNRDGWPDLAIANADLEGVTLLLSTGRAGEFTERVHAMPGANPRGIALGDRDRDGALDVIVTEYATGAWRVLYGDGTGSVAREDRFGAISRPQGVVAADFNHDGWLDVAIAGTGIDMVAILQHGGRGPRAAERDRRGGGQRPGRRRLQPRRMAGPRRRLFVEQRHLHAARVGERPLLAGHVLDRYVAARHGRRGREPGRMAGSRHGEPRVEHRRDPPGNASSTGIVRRSAPRAGRIPAAARSRRRTSIATAWSTSPRSTSSAAAPRCSGTRRRS